MPKRSNRVLGLSLSPPADFRSTLQLSPLLTNMCTAALIFCGAVRTLTSPLVHQSIATHLISPLSKNCPLDVFYHLSLSDHDSPRSASTLPFPPTPNATWTSLAPAFDATSPISIEIAGSNLPPTTDRETLSQISRWAAALDQILRRGKYDWILRARPDAIWLHDAPDLSTLPRDRVWLGDNYNPINDQLALCGVRRTFR